MSYQIEKVADEPILFSILNADYKLDIDGQSGVSDLLALLDAQSIPVYMVFDVRAISLNFNELLHGVSLVTRQYQLLKHHNVRETAVVTEKTFLKSAVEGLSNPLFGNVKIHAFDSLETAFEYVRAQIAAT